jgi:asparagine N-glycosylation enzyme membrane subunit Stt3
VFVSFDIPVFLFWLFVSCFLPGSVISLSIFRKDDLLFIEKLLIGFAIGMASIPLIPFMLYLFLGVSFSYTIAIISVAVMYILAIACVILTKSYEGLKIPGMDSVNAIAASLTKNPSPLLIPSLLAILLIISYIIRLSTYSPIYQELDPYYYTYVAQQILTTGYNMQNDSTAWYPELVVSHRAIPEISYLESIWYSLYTGGGHYDNMLLALTASMYPPIAAALAIFFIYLLVSSIGKREWGLTAAGIAAFVPVFIFKLFAGEQEVQPYAFFALTFFYAMYALSLKKKDLRFAALAGLAFAALSLGSSTQILALISAVIFIIAESILLFLRDDDPDGLRSFTISNAIVFVIGPLFGSMILRDIFSSGSPTLSMVVPFLAALGFSGLLWALKLKLPAKREIAVMALGVVIIVGLFVFMFTPIGAYIRSEGVSAFGITQYNTPLDRTIAEQGGAPDSFGGEIGFVSDTYDGVSATILSPITAILSTSSPALTTSIVSLCATALSDIFWIFSAISNLLLAIFVGVVNVFLGTSVSFAPKTNSFLLFWLFAFCVAAIYGAWKFVKKEDDSSFILFLAMIMPPLVVGLIKAKYTIYSGVLFAISIGFTFSVIDRFLKDDVLGKLLKDEEAKSASKWILIAVAAILVLAQFTYHGFAPSLIFGATQQLYQNDPLALQPKLQAFCQQSNDTEVCAAAADPMGYASNGTNKQYSSKLCALSIYSNYSFVANPGTAPPVEYQAVSMRCQRITDYWISSMEWLKNSTEPGARIVSWWDYGHWINFFGDRNAVVRNEHASHEMIGDVADAYLDSTPEELKSWMNAHSVRYALFDIELLMGGNQFGGKYGALNYLSCAHHDLTNVSLSPGESQCEADHLWETVMVSQNPCAISSLTNKTGFLAYKMYYDIFQKGPDGKPVYTSTGRPVVMQSVYQPYYTSDCMNPTDQNIAYYCKTYVRAVPVYCFGQTTLADGRQMYAPYSLNETNPNGDLKLVKAIAQFSYPIEQTSHFGPATGVTLLYTKDPIWLENGMMVSGYGDRPGKFYDSALYQALLFDAIPGFREVYTNGAVKIFAIAE